MPYIVFGLFQEFSDHRSHSFRDSGSSGGVAWSAGFVFRLIARYLDFLVLFRHSCVTVLDGEERPARLRLPHSREIFMVTCILICEETIIVLLLKSFCFTSFVNSFKLGSNLFSPRCYLDGMEDNSETKSRGFDSINRH